MGRNPPRKAHRIIKDMLSPTFFSAVFLWETLDGQYSPALFFSAAPEAPEFRRFAFPSSHFRVPEPAKMPHSISVAHYRIIAREHGSGAAQRRARNAL